MKRNTCFLTAFLFALNVTAHAQSNIILDTDIGSDCDDAGALAVLNKLADKGETHMLGVIYSSGKNKYGTGVCDAIDTYYGRSYIPLGQYKGDDIGDASDHYSKAIATNRSRFHHRTVDSAADLVTTYKAILQKQPDSSVTIVTIGHPYGLILLMRDSSAFSLVKAKVKKWVAMTGTSSTPVRDWNFGRNGVQYYIDTLLKNWPTAAYFSSIGKKIITGNKRLPNTPDDNPVKEAYKLWNNALRKGRYSWDPVTVLFAVRPQYFHIDTTGSLKQNGRLETYWDKKDNNPRQFLVARPSISNLDLQHMIEDLMSEPPVKKRIGPSTNIIR